MKKAIFLLGCLSLLLLGILSASYNKEEIDLPETMSFTCINNKVMFTTMAQSPVVDWGDGTTNEDVNAKYASVFSHTYQNSAEHTVRIQAKELSYFSCVRQQLTALDVSGCTELAVLACTENRLTALDVSRHTELVELKCDVNELTTLDVSNNTKLTWLQCGYNQLTTLDVSSNTELTGLSCYNNQLTALDVSRNTELTGLGCSGNQLTTLDVSRNTELTWLHCGENQLTAAALNTIFTSLPTVRSGKIYISGNPGTAGCDRSIATAKGWSVEG
jgi:Leucine-rich repeat (LRR) protein